VIALLLLQAVLAGAPTTVSSHARRFLLTVTTFTSNESTGLSNAYLLAGRRDAILIDAVPTRAESSRLADSIRRSRKHLKLIFITHAHPSDQLGLDVLLERFPGARVVSTPEVCADVRAFGHPVVPQPIDSLAIEGATLKILKFENGESMHAAAVYDPSARRLFAGDLVGSNVHLNVREKRIDGWLRQLDALEKLPVDRIEPGHGAAGGVSLIAETRGYLHDFAAALKGALPDQVRKRMLEKYPRRRVRENLERSIASFFPG